MNMLSLSIYLSIYLSFTHTHLLLYIHHSYHLLPSCALSTIKYHNFHRFSDLNGKLDYDIFLKSYEFLDAKQEREMKSLEKRIKRTKDETKKTELKSSYHKIKQDLVGRRRHQSFKEKLKKSKEIEKEKVANGKKPYFMKESAKKEMARESRYVIRNVVTYTSTYLFTCTLIHSGSTISKRAVNCRPSCQRKERRMLIRIESEYQRVEECRIGSFICSSSSE